MQPMALLNTDEVTKMLRISKTTLYRWIEKNQIPFIRFNGHFRFRQKDIEEFLDSYFHKHVINE